MELILRLIIGFVIVSIIIAVFPGVRAWIDGGSEGVKDYKKQKRDNY
ncbi:MAG: hypothetical protein QF864_15960 [SAR202 cluster bacterium]|jgi:hypothetical protein|nr:hypothetical protein [SAR202 cluster bacterium]|tara:strand:+ start:168 stop:308 length:141 start_codon:yes stop_codon:yes gene_type:complete